MDEHEWRVTGVLVAASVVVWFLADRFTDGTIIKWAILILGVVVLPRAYVEYRRAAAAKAASSDAGEGSDADDPGN